MILSAVTNSVRSLGAGRFDQRDISSVARILQRVEKNGGDVDHVIVGNEQELHAGEVRRPTNLFDRSNLPAGANSGTNNASEQNQSSKPSKRGLAFFKENFGEEKGEEFFEAMTRKYDALKVSGFTSTEKLTYAQVQRQLREKEQLYKKRNGEIKKSQSAVKMKDSGGDRGKEER